MRKAVYKTPEDHSNFQSIALYIPDVSEPDNPSIKHTFSRSPNFNGALNKRQSTVIFRIIIHPSIRI